MIDTELTRLAADIAKEAHAGQTDRGGTPYILHPLHVADRMPDEKRAVIAVLHDVLEDTDLTAEDLVRAGIPEDM
ncbi:MAG: GTP pyrophosphokinase, partial [Lachnospiraceae bacterium]|nr:GTP pyrophosphokinase [Lachnospiraceae bacterium]